jgi:mRNA interferase MazF
MPAIGGRVPEAGDVYWIDYGIPVGHEQGGRRPSIVLTSRSYNERSSIVVTCPISRKRREWPFQVEISWVGSIAGYALVDQLRAIDPLARPARFAGAVSAKTMADIHLALSSLLKLA